MYVGQYVHGVLNVYRASKPKCDAEFARILQTYITTPMTYVFEQYAPGYARLKCKNNACKYVPCIVISMQSDTPEIPKEYVKP